MIHVTATSTGMLDWDVMIDLSLEKTNTPPVITVETDQIDGSQATWASDQFSFTLSGEVYDPDGGDVQLSATMCGETTTSFTGERPNWDVSLSIAKCVADGLTQYDVTLSATDSVGEISIIEVSVAVLMPEMLLNQETLIARLKKADYPQLECLQLCFPC